MSKYIIKNCPCFDTYSTQCYDTPTLPIIDIPLCQDCTDCVIKQIITICKQYKMSKEDMKRSKEYADIIRGSKYGSDALANQILQLFDIEEVRE